MLRVGEFQGAEIETSKALRGDFQPTRDLGNIVSSLSGVWGGTTVGIEFGEILTPKFNYWRDKI